MSSPFILRFRTPNKYYVYDVNTNCFLQVSEVVYDVMGHSRCNSWLKIADELSGKYDRKTIMRAVTEINQFQRTENVFSAFRPLRLFFPKTLEEVENALNTKMQQLILCVTEQCNLRCRYCIFSGSYKYQRTHTPRWMSFDVAKKAVDLFVRCSSQSEFPALGFYGGEPLLAFSLIEQVVEYVNAKYKNKLSFHITTNGTLLTSDVTQFLVQNNFNIVISLDGPAPIHDAMRVYPDGRGSFDIIMQNLHDMGQKYPEYFKKNVGFNVSLSVPDKIEDVYNFFLQKESILKGKRLTINQIDYEDTDLFENGVLKISDGRAMMNMIKHLVEQAIDGHGLDPFLKALLENPLIRIHQRCSRQLQENHYPNGICVPGVRRIFCDTDGNFSLCERINPNLYIGHVDKGVCADFVMQLIENYVKTSSPDCIECWAIRFCPACYCQLYRDQYDISKKRAFCMAECQNLSLAMAVYCAVREENDHAWDFLDDITLG